MNFKPLSRQRGYFLGISLAITRHAPPPTTPPGSSSLFLLADGTSKFLLANGTDRLLITGA